MKEVYADCMCTHELEYLLCAHELEYLCTYIFCCGMSVYMSHRIMIKIKIV